MPLSLPKYLKNSSVATTSSLSAVAAGELSNRERQTVIVEGRAVTGKLIGKEEQALFEKYTQNIQRKRDVG